MTSLDFARAAGAFVMLTQKKYPEWTDDQRHFFNEMIVNETDSYLNARWEIRRKFEVDQLFKRVKAKTVLDVGCGIGFHDMLMAEKSGVDHVTGIDYSIESINRANAFYPHRKVHRTCIDFNNLKSPPFDLVVSFHVIEHLATAGNFLARCAELSTGKVAVFTTNWQRLGNRIRCLIGDKPKLGDPQHYHEFTVDDLSAVANWHGLKVIDHFSYGLHHTPLRLGMLLAPIADMFCLVMEKKKAVLK